jgi:hypothetical protein
MSLPDPLENSLRKVLSVGGQSSSSKVDDGDSHLQIAGLLSIHHTMTDVNGKACASRLQAAAHVTYTYAMKLTADSFEFQIIEACCRL